MLRDAIDIAVLAQPAQPVIDAVVVHEVQDLLASARGSERAGMRDTHVQGECEHGDHRDEEWGGAETHFDNPTQRPPGDPSEHV
jgi:hypothetical protein